MLSEGRQPDINAGSALRVSRQTRTAILLTDLHGPDSAVHAAAAMGGWTCLVLWHFQLELADHRIPRDDESRG
jgi:hypothetical protein